ncbi:MAG TPA: hypothetical protein VEQ59_06815 [Polyangiaceae bacterium]|nr:hypothetical protein [Polyangiaceae bacterium]
MTLPLEPLVALGSLAVGAVAGLAAYHWKGVKTAAALGAKPPEAKGLPVDLLGPYRAVEKDLGAELRFGPGVVALGDAGWKSSRVLERLSGGSPATPAGDGAQMRTYRSRDAIVVELSDELVHNDAVVVQQALRRLARALPSGVVILALAIDYRALVAGDAVALSAWAQVLKKRLSLLDRAGRSVGLRVCITGMDAERGYETLRALWLNRSSSPLSWAIIEDRARLQQLLGAVGAELGGVLSARPEELESVVRLLEALPDALGSLKVLTIPLADTLARFTQPELSGVYLTDADGRALPARPFTFEPSDVLPARARFERGVRLRQAALAGVLCLAIVAAFVVAGFRLNSIAEATHLYATSAGPLNAATAPASPSTISQTSSSVPVETSDRATRAADRLASLRLWPLPFAFAPERRRTEQAFVAATRRFYVQPALTPQRSLARRVFAACADRATADNDYGRLVTANLSVFSASLGVPAPALAALVRLREDDEVSPDVPTLTTAASSVAAWQKLVSAIVTAVNAGVFVPARLSELQGAAFLAELPPDAEALRVLQQAVSLLAAHVDRAQPSEVEAAEQIQSELSFVLGNFAALQTLHGWFVSAPRLSELRPARSLQELVQLTLGSPAVAAPAPLAGEVTIAWERPVAIQRGAFEQALARTRANVLIAAFIELRRKPSAPGFAESACSDPSAAVGTAGSSFFALAGKDWGRAATESPGLERLDSLRVTGPSSQGLGPTAALPGWFTRDAFDQFVSPVLSMAPTDAQIGQLTREDLQTLRSFIDEELSAYALRYGAELRCYYGSFRFQPPSLTAVQAAVLELAADGSWFAQFLANVARQAGLPPEVLASSAFGAALAGFSPLVATVNGKALKDYDAILLAAVPAPAGAEAPAELAKPAAETTTAQLLRKPPIDERLNAAMRSLVATAPASTATQQLTAWLASQQLSGIYQRPFLLPLDGLRSTALFDIRTRWQKELVAPTLPLLRRYPFRPDRGAGEQPVSVSELEAELAPAGRFWAVVAETFAPVLEAREGRNPGERSYWVMRSGLNAPRGMLDLLQGAERLTTALWTPDGKRRKLKLRLTPYELPSSPRGESLVALARLSLPGAAVQSFNQALEPRTLGIEWWSEDEASLSVELLDRYASEVDSSPTLVSKTGPWSFLSLLESGQLEDNVLSFYLYGEARKDARIEFEVGSDLRALFRELANAAEATKEPTR